MRGDGGARRHRRRRTRRHRRRPISEVVDLTESDCRPGGSTPLLEPVREAGWAVLLPGTIQDSFSTGGRMNTAVTMASDAVYEHRSRTRDERRLTKDELFDIEDRDDT